MSKCLDAAELDLPKTTSSLDALLSAVYLRMESIDIYLHGYRSSSQHY